MGTRRARKKAMKRAQRAVGEIPGVPAYQGGTNPWNLLSSGMGLLGNVLDYAQQPQDPYFPGGTPPGLAPTGTPGVYYDMGSGRIID